MPIKVFIPFWLLQRGSKAACNTTTVPSSVIQREFVEYTSDLFYSLATGSGCQMLECPQPCTEIRVTSRLTYRFPAWPVKKIQINLASEVKNVQHNTAYGSFELIVDIGSSLGLWIGLSFLGIYDQALEGIKWIKTACSRSRDRSQDVTEKKSSHP